MTDTLVKQQSKSAHQVKIILTWAARSDYYKNGFKKKQPEPRTEYFGLGD